jgi:hypothetical protein
LVLQASRSRHIQQSRHHQPAKSLVRQRRTPSANEYCEYRSPRFRAI